MGINQNYKLINTINHIKLNWYTNAICNIKDNILLIIDIQKCQIISFIQKHLVGIGSILKLADGNILIGCTYLIEYKYDNNDLTLVKWKTDNFLIIYGLLEMKDGEIISCSGDKTINFGNKN